LVHAIEAVRQRLQINRWNICGQSFGAALTLRYALTFPDRVIAQIFTNANGALREAWNASQHDRNLAQLHEIRNEGHAAMRRMAYHPGRARRFPPDLREVLTLDADATDVNGIALLLEHAMPHLSLRDRLGELCVPTLLVNGLWEKRFQPARQWLSRAHPRIAVEDLQGGHSINIECPDGFNAAASVFLSAHQ
jgi:pimeloyl-ACP methyl ester carboxylesterase